MTGPEFVDDGRQNKAKKELGYTTHKETEPIALENQQTSLSERRPPGYDPFTLSEEERKDLGITENEEIAWVRHPAVWRNIEGLDHGIVTKRTGGRVILQNGIPVSMGNDLMLVTFPKELKEQERREHEERQREFERTVENQAWEGQFKPMTSEELERRVEEDKQMVRNSGLAGPGSPTHRMPADAVERGLVEPEQAMLWSMRARRGGRSATEKEAEVERALEARLEQKRTRGRRFYSIPK